jgi:hypothetical protein
MDFKMIKPNIGRATIFRLVVYLSVMLAGAFIFWILSQAQMPTTQLETNTATPVIREEKTTTYLEIEGSQLIPFVFTRLKDRPDVFAITDGEKVGYFRIEEIDVPARKKQRFIPIDSDPFGYNDRPKGFD